MITFLCNVIVKLLLRLFLFSQPASLRHTNTTEIVSGEHQQKGEFTHIAHGKASLKFSFNVFSFLYDSTLHESYHIPVYSVPEKSFQLCSQMPATLFSFFPVQSSKCAHIPQLARQKQNKTTPSQIHSHLFFPLNMSLRKLSLSHHKIHK